MNNSILKFASQPVSTIIDIYQSKDKEDEIEKGLQSIRSENIKNIALSPEITEKINNFVKNELKINTDNKVLFLKDDSINDMTPAATIGSLNLPSGAIIILTSPLVDLIKGEFTDDIKFCIAHELAHVINDDFYNEKFVVEKRASFLQIAAYAATVGVSSYLFPLSLFASHLLGCSISKGIREYYIHTTRVEKELLADKFAANVSDSIAKGGIQLISSMKERNLEMYNHVKEYLKAQEEKAESLQDSLLAKIDRVKLKIMFSSKEGTSRFDPNPSFDERAKMLESYNYAYGRQILLNAAFKLSMGFGKKDLQNNSIEEKLD